MTYSLGRVRVVEGTPPVAPGKCVVCGNSGDKDSKFIDFGFDIDFYGVVYFCLSCINESITLLGYIPKELLDNALDKLAETQFKLEAFEAQNQELKSVIDTLHRNGFTAPVTDSEQSDVVAPIPEVSETAESISRKTTSPKPRPPKSVNESGSTSVRDNDTFEEFNL